MPLARPTLRASILITFVQSILYGLYTATLVHCFRWLLYEDEGWKLRPRNKINWRMLAISTLIYVFSTVDLGLLLSNTLTHGDTSNSTEKLFAMRPVIEDITLLLTDAVLILRCWAIYDKSWRIIFLPLLLWVSDVAIMVTFVCRNAIVSKELSGFFQSPLICAFFYTCNLAINFYAAAAIGFKIWTVARYSGNATGYLCTTGRILAESGIMYSATSLMFLVSLFVFEGDFDPLTGILCAVNFSMAGIAFNLILIRAGRQRAKSLGPAIDVQCMDIRESASELSYHNGLNIVTAIDPCKDSYLENTRRGLGP